ncbi:MAG: M48 family metallopeptidase [Bacteroidota bacterium]
MLQISSCLCGCLLMLVGRPGFASAQDFDHYEIMRSQGKIPAELLRRSSEKYADQRETLARAQNRSVRRSQSKFLLQSSFLIDDLLLSGKVLFNDPVTAYLTQVKDHLLRDRPELRDEVRIYLVRSSSVNAFATNDGIILFNIGLFARLESEAQLAYILSHELQHYIYRHPINRFVVTDQIVQQGVFDRDDLEATLLARNQYSRELELEADEKGLELFRQSGYALAEIDGIFDILSKAHLPLAQVPWEPEFFARPNLRFPATYRLDTVAALSTREAEDDSESTHPNIASRRQRVREKLGDVLENDTGSRFLVDETNFARLRKTCRYEIAQILLEQRRYEAAIYHAHLLLQEDPGSFFLEKTVAHALYSLARYKNERSFYAVHDDYENVEGEAQRVNFFLEQMKKAALNVLAIDWCWRLHVADPGDRELNAMCRDLLEDFFATHREIAESMSDQAVPEGFFAPWEQGSGERLPDSDPTETESLGERDARDTEGENTPEVDYFQHAFAEFFDNSEFSIAYRGLMNAEPEANNVEYRSPRRRRRQARREALRGQALGLNKVVFVDPMFKRIDERKEITTEYLASERGQEDFLGMIHETAEAAGLDHDILSNRELEVTDADRFNDLVFIERWIAQYMAMWDEELKMVNLYANEAQAIAEKYGSDHFAYTGMLILTRRKKTSTVLGLVLSGVLIVPLPFVLIAVLRPRRSVLYLNLVFDVEQNELALEEGRRMRLAPRKYIIKSNLYSSMHQLKRK